MFGVFLSEKDKYFLFFLGKFAIHKKSRVLCTYCINTNKCCQRIRFRLSVKKNVILANVLMQIRLSFKIK